MLYPTYSVIVYPSAELPALYNALIYSKWLRSLRFGNPLFKKMESNEYYKNYHLYLENLLKKPDSVVRLAALTDDRDVVLGFAVSREDVLDYVHVHKDYRKIGIGSALFPKSTTTFTHITMTALKIWQENERYKSLNLKFNPFA